MLVLRGNGDCDSSDKVVAFGVGAMRPLLALDPQGVVAARSLRVEPFSRNPKLRSVTRDPEDTVAHVHDKHVLLIRSGAHVPDDTLVCDHRAALHALLGAAVANDLRQKLAVASLNTGGDIDDLLETCINGCDLLEAGAGQELPRLMENGAEAIRTGLARYPAALAGEIKYELFKTFVAAQHLLSEQSRTVVRWDEQGIDALLLGAGAGHARSLLNVDPSAVDRPALDAALGTGPARAERGLHYFAFSDPQQ